MSKEIHYYNWEGSEELLLDPLAALTMTYTIDGFNELVQDISKNGLLVPILLRDGKILDGRHRYKACMELGINISYIELGSISSDEALDIVISNAINKATGTDASKVEAYLMCRAKGIKKNDMSNKFSRLNINYVRKLSYIEKENPEYLQVLLRQNSVRLYNKKYEKMEDYGTINGIWRTLKDNKIMEDTVVEVVAVPNQDIRHEVSIEDIMVSPSAEKAYWDLYETLREVGVVLHPASAAGRQATYCINSTFSE
jgi:hypothetical protein